MKSLSIQGNQEIEIHRYRFIAGGRLEVHKRNLWKFGISATFQSGYVSVDGLQHFPEVASLLRSYFQSNRVGVLTIPHIGKINAIIDSWDETFNAASPFGIDVNISFLEYGTSSFDPVSVTRNTATFKSNARLLRKLAASRPKQPSLLKQLFDTADKIIGFRDQISMNAELLSSAVDSLKNLIIDLDRTWEDLQDVENWPLVVALNDLWIVADDLVSSPESKVVQPRYFVADEKMSVTDAAYRIYGDKSRARDLLELNQFNDAMMIPPGKKILYIPDSI